MSQNSILEKIHFPDDLRKIHSLDELQQLAQEIRTFLIDTLSEIDHAHFSSNLGVVELSIALHHAFDTPNDALFWDIGHQGYVHKLLTGRRKQLPSIRTKNGISGFLSRGESMYDDFGAGHAGTSISAALGAAVASKLMHSEKHHVAIIGDASLISGMAFEALNHLSDFDHLNLTIVINDNDCSIDSSIGGLSRHLKSLMSTHEFSFFSSLGISYLPPVDGHQLPQLLESFKKCKSIGGIHIVHCITEKGKGYFPAEFGSKAHWHAPGKFDKTTGNSFKKSVLRYQDVFAQTLIELAGQNPKIVAISAGMLSGTSLNKFQEIYPDRCFDVGIAEQHAVTFSAGLATQGLIPFCVIYSTFIQRALDQVIHDVALQNLPVIFCIDRAGLVGHDGATHQGIFDISFLRGVPNLAIASPSNTADLKNLLYSAQLQLDFPLVIRYPRGLVKEQAEFKDLKAIEWGKSQLLSTGKDIVLIGIGTIVQELHKVRDLLKASGIDVGICDALFIKPLDEKLLHSLFSTTSKIVTIEEHVLMGGFGSAIVEFMVDNGYTNPLLRCGIPDEFVEHATQNEQQAQYQLDAKGIATRVHQWITKNNECYRY